MDQVAHRKPLNILGKMSKRDRHSFVRQPVLTAWELLCQLCQAKEMGRIHKEQIK